MLALSENCGLNTPKASVPHQIPVASLPNCFDKRLKGPLSLQEYAESPLHHQDLEQDWTPFRPFFLSLTAGCQSLEVHAIKFFPTDRCWVLHAS